MQFAYNHIMSMTRFFSYLFEFRIKKHNFLINISLIN